MAYTDIPTTDVDVDSPLDEDLFGALVDNDNELRTNLFAVDIPENTTGSGSYVTLVSFGMYLPDLADVSGLQRALTFEFECKTTAGTATYKVTDNGAAVDSTEATTTSATYEAKEVVLNFATGLKGTVRTIDVKAKTTSGTCYLRVQNRITSRVQY